MTLANRLGLLLAAFVILSGTSSLAQLPIQDIQLFNPTDLPPASTLRGDQALAIDNDLDTFSYLTPSYSQGPRYAGLDFASAVSVNRLQVTKFSNVDGVGSPADPMDLQLLYTTDLGPIKDRQYQPVSGLTNGYLGAELIMADSVNPADATVVADITDGTYSLSFNSIDATGLALGYKRNPGGDNIDNYYPTAEFTPMNGTTPHAPSGIDIWRPEVPAGSYIANRGDQLAAIDGDTNTWTYLTKSFTDYPTAIALELGSATLVNRIRVNKVTNFVTGEGIVVPINVQILYTTDTGPLNERTYQPVAGLTTGFNGTELINATGVDSATATVLSEVHQFPTDGWFSLTFNEIDATAIAYVISKPDVSVHPYINYPIAEFELYHSAVAHPGDFDGDGFVDGDDLTEWRNDFGAAGSDADSDGDSDGNDFLVWQRNLGLGTPSQPVAGAVPEPAASTLFALASVAAYYMACRRAA